MAWPQSISEISTNLNKKELIEIIKAIDNNNVKWLIDGASYAGASTHYCIYKNKKYRMFEMFEITTSLIKI